MAGLILSTGQTSKPACMAVPSGIPEQVSVDLTFSDRLYLFWLNAVVKLCFIVENLLTI